jgi:hypothetical protein
MDKVQVMAMALVVGCGATITGLVAGFSLPTMVVGGVVGIGIIVGLYLLCRLADATEDKYSRRAIERRLVERFERDEQIDRARQKEFDAECLAFEQEREVEFDDLVFEPEDEDHRRARRLGRFWD